MTFAAYKAVKFLVVLKAEGRRQEAGGRRQEAGGRRQKAVTIYIVISRVRR
ncbi:MAG: hypothetical protein F6K21_24320 [Symploca sp. SIO2D2]|nr:hypothetical protein [Symploca sp. SIO2D2]